MYKILATIMMIGITTFGNAQEKPSVEVRAERQTEKISANMPLNPSEKRMVEKECLQFQKNTDALRKSGKKENSPEYKESMNKIRSDFYLNVKKNLNSPAQLEAWEKMNKNVNKAN